MVDEPADQPPAGGNARLDGPGREWEETLRRYATDAMSAQEEAEFEDRVAADERLYLAVEAYLACRDAGGPGRTAGASPGKAAATVVRTPFALAACLVLGGVLGSLLSIALMRGPEAAIVTPEVFSLEPLRAATPLDGAGLLRLDAEHQWITLLVYPDNGDYRAFRIRIERLQGGQRRAVWDGKGIPAGDGQRLALLVRRDALESGLHRVRIEGLPADAPGEAAYVEAGDTAFRVERVD